MKRQSRKERDLKVLRLWTHADATKALPYIRRVTRSIRDEWLALQGARHRVRRLDAAPGRPDRTRLLQRQTAVEDTDRASDRFDAAMQELLALDIFCLDPVAGQALIPFRQGDELAWFVYDLFDPKRLDNWRFHHDPLEKRRPVAEGLPQVPKAGIN